MAKCRRCGSVIDSVARANPEAWYAWKLVNEGWNENRVERVTLSISSQSGALHLLSSY